MSESMLQLVEEALASPTPATAPHPIRDELLPRLEQARNVEEAEAAIHEVAKNLRWLGESLAAGADGEVVVPRMLAMQDDLERLVAAGADALVARKAVLAHETLRRFLVIGSQARQADSEGALPEAPHATRTSSQYMNDVAMRLALLVAAIEYLAPLGGHLVAALAHKAFETSQTLRRATRDLGFDLTPWVDAPAATRIRRIQEAARGFWSALDPEQRRAIDEAWGERLELPPRWPLPSS